MDNESRFHTVQPHRDLESNWTVDLAKNLEEYLFKICSGDISPDNQVNFAEAALLLQSSIQVYSRKVEYLYNLVLHALEFVSQTRSQDQVETTSVQPEASTSRAVQDEDDQFWVSDDIPVDGKNSLDSVASKDTSLDHIVKAPANLVVLEGDRLDSTDGGELETYLLATNNLYRDFILLDPCDATVVDEFLKAEKSGNRQHVAYRGSSVISKAAKSFLSPARYSGGTACKSSVRKGLERCAQVSPFGGANTFPNDGFEPGPSNYDISDHGNHGFESDDNNSHHEDFDDSDDGDDPWKPLNPHEPGNLKVKPFKKVNTRKKNGLTKNVSVNSQFPLAKLRGTISPELTGIWELHSKTREKQEESQPIPLFEKLRQTLVGGHPNHDHFCPFENGDTEDISDDGVYDFDQPNNEMPDVDYMNERVDIEQNKHDGFADHCDAANAELKEDPSSQPSLEDLCRAHLDSLLASIAESEKQTELAARVSSWKQRIEDDLEEEDLRPPFDIHEYGESVLERLSLVDDDDSAVSFTDVVKGQEKHDVARTFSALLQLVNDRKVDLELSTSTRESFCYSALNPFHVRLLRKVKVPVKMQFQLPKKRQKSPIKENTEKGDINHLSRQSSAVSSPSGSKSRAISAQPNCKYSTKLEKGGLRYTPDGKRRRRSRLADLNSAR